MAVMRKYRIAYRTNPTANLFLQGALLTTRAIYLPKESSATFKDEAKKTVTDNTAATVAMYSVTSTFYSMFLVGRRD